MPITTQAQLDLARKVYAHVTEHPDQHDQANWWRQTSCGTAACIAGWATHFAGALPAFETVDDENLATHVHPPEGGVVGIEEYAQELLGLDDDEATDLFDGSQPAPDAVAYLDLLIAEGELAVAGGAR